jgi:hypothetical protein
MLANDELDELQRAEEEAYQGWKASLWRGGGGKRG